MTNTPRFLLAFLLCAACAVPATAQTSPAAVPATPLTDTLTGKGNPPTLPAEKIDNTFLLIDLVDAQGKPGTYATQGKMQTLAGEPFLICYSVPLTVPITHPARPKAGTVAVLVLINVKFVQAVVNIRPVPDANALLPDPAAALTR